MRKEVLLIELLTPGNNLIHISISLTLVLRSQIFVSQPLLLFCYQLCKDSVVYLMVQFHDTNFREWLGRLLVFVTGSAWKFISFSRIH